MARLTLMIACEQLKDESLIQAIKEQAEKGIRIYLLLGEKNANKVAIDVLSGRCLIRTGVSQKGALMVVDHTTTQAQGLLLMSGQHLVSADQPVWESSWSVSRSMTVFVAFANCSGKIAMRNTCDRTSNNPAFSIRMARSLPTTPISYAAP